MTTHFLKNSGSLQVSVEDVIIDYFGESDFGATEIIPEREKEDYMNVSFTIVMYNPSEVKKHIDKITFELIGNNNKILVKTELNDLKTAKVMQYMTSYNQLKHINCEAKDLQRSAVNTTVNFKQQALNKYRYMTIAFRTNRKK